MAEKVNYIGAEYRASFESVIKLIASGCLAGSDLDLVAEGTGSAQRIIDRRSNSVFVCGKSARRAEESPLLMGEDGATWFGALRGEAREFPNSAWLSLIDKVASAYHKRYSLVEYRQRKRTKEEEQSLNDYGQAVVQRLVNTFYPQLKGCKTDMPKGAGGDDIYGLSLRLGLSGGTGEAQPVLCRVYFRRKDNRLYPIESTAAEQVDTYISEAVLTADATAAPSAGGVDPTIVDASLNALGELLNPRLGVSRFSECICFPKRPGEDESRDAKIIADLTSKMLNAQKTIECKSIRVLGITHVKWESTLLDIVREGKRIFRLYFGPNKTISLQCLNCRDGSYIVENNLVRVTDDEGTREIAIDPLRDDFGLDGDTVNLLRKQVFSRHLGTLACNVRGTHCERTVCHSQTTEFGKDLRRCTYCPYPEIVWTDEKDIARYTPSLAFVHDKRALLPKEETAKCFFCGRTFSKSYLVRTEEFPVDLLCPFCADAVRCEGESAARAAKNYGKYAGVLPIGFRIAALGRKKYCYENEDLLFFIVGRNGYYLNKMDIGDVGYLAKFRKFRIR